MPIPRFKLRTLLLMVALFAVALAVVVEISQRRNRFQRLADDHWKQTLLLPEDQIDINGYSYVENQATRTKIYTGKNMRDIDYHDLLYRKYEYAASHPWLPVEPDPPPPAKPDPPPPAEVNPPEQ